MVLCSSSSWASLRCRTIVRVLTSSVTVLPRSANSSATLLCSSSSGSNSTVLKLFLGVTAAMRVKALVSLNKVSHCGSGVSEETVNYNLDFFQCSESLKPSLKRSLRRVIRFSTCMHAIMVPVTKTLVLQISLFKISLRHLHSKYCWQFKPRILPK